MSVQSLLVTIHGTLRLFLIGSSSNLEVKVTSQTISGKYESESIRTRRRQIRIRRGKQMEMALSISLGFGGGNPTYLLHIKSRQLFRPRQAAKVRKLSRRVRNAVFDLAMVCADDNCLRIVSDSNCDHVAHVAAIFRTKK